MSLYILLDDGCFFDGTQDQFRDCFFDNADSNQIFDWAASQDLRCEIRNYSQSGLAPGVRVKSCSGNTGTILRRDHPEGWMVQWNSGKAYALDQRKLARLSKQP